jgi:hypothetical protein
MSAVDDTKVHRSSPHVWGTCTFHEYTARCPNRATTVRAHNWVILGDLLHEPGKPAWFLPISGRLYFRKSRLPLGPNGIQEQFNLVTSAVELTGLQMVELFAARFREEISHPDYPSSHNLYRGGWAA